MTPLGGSVRTRITIAASVVVGLTLVLGGWVLLLTLRHSLEQRDDAAARGWAHDLAALSATGSLPLVIPPHGEEDIAQVVEAGAVVASTAHPSAERPVASFAAGRDPVVRTVHVEDQGEREAYRAWGLLATSQSGRPVTVYAATSQESVSATVATVRRLLLAGLPIALLLIVASAWVAVGRALRPVEAIRAGVAAISHADLGRRVPVPAGDDEVAHLAVTMNAMLGRLESARDQQRSFVADASHELQSPLAQFRAQLEVALARPEQAAWPAVAAELLAGSREMERLVRDLLFLARDDESAPGRPDAQVDLDDVVLDEAARLRASVARVHVDTSAVSAAPVRGSRSQLTQLTRNLLENAEQHAASRVVVRLRADDTGAELVVADDGPGVPQADRDRVFERFVRLDSSRTGRGSGLGLAIVAAIAARHGGTVALDGDGQGATFVVRLPP